MTRKALNAHLRDTGLFFPIDPGADASLGGMAATRACGTNAVRYGTMRENVLGLTVVIADGRIVRTGGRARKSSAGYDLTRLFVGSEGTLGIITEIQLRLYGIPEAMSAAVCSFTDLKGAVDTVIAVIQSGIPVARIELLDALQMQAVNAYSKLDYPEQPTLFFEFHGSAAGVEEQAQAAGELAEAFGGGGFQWATRAEDRNRLWAGAARRALGLEGRCGPGALAWATDVCVPISRLADCILATRQDVRRARAGGADRRACRRRQLPPDLPDRPATGRRSSAPPRRCADRLVDRALAMGGTCTGEHGVGTGKIGYLEQEHGAGVELMRTIKRALRPAEHHEPGQDLSARPRGVSLRLLALFGCEQMVMSLKSIDKPNRSLRDFNSRGHPSSATRIR